MCVTTYISYLAYKLFHNQFSFMLGKHENTFPLLPGCKIALFLYHLLTKRMLYLHSCSSVDPALAQEPGTIDSWSSRWEAECYPFTPASPVFVLQTNRPYQRAEFGFRSTDLLITASQVSQPASAAAKQTPEGTNQHRLCWHLLKDSICPRALWDKNLSPKKSSIPWGVV